MFLCFIDESQTPPNPGQVNRPPYFIISGIIINEAQWHDIAGEFKALKAKPEYNIRGEIKWRFFGPTNQDAHNSVAHLDQEHRDSFRNEMYDILTKRKAVKIISCIASVAAAYKTEYVNSQEDFYHYTYKCVSERFQYFLQDMERTAGSKQLGLIVADHRGKRQDEALQRRHHALIDQNAPIFSQYPNYIETLFLTPSHNSVGIQFADMVAGAVGRRFNANDDHFYNRIEPAFRKSPVGNVNGYGIVKFPTQGWV